MNYEKFAKKIKKINKKKNQCLQTNDSRLWHAHNKYSINDRNVHANKYLKRELFSTVI